MDVDIAALPPPTPHTGDTPTPHTGDTPPPHAGVGGGSAMEEPEPDVPGSSSATAGGRAGGSAGGSAGGAVKEEPADGWASLATLGAFGYEYDAEGKLVQCGGGGVPFEWVNQAHYDALGEAVVAHIQSELVERFGLVEVMLPLGPDAADGRAHFEATVAAGQPIRAPGVAPDALTTKVFVSPDLFTNTDKLMVLIHGSGAVRAGMWARKLCMNDTLDAGTVFPYVADALAEGYAVAVLNPNENKVKVGDTDVYVSGSETPEDHTLYVHEMLLAHAPAAQLFIVAHSFGGICTTVWLEEYGDELLDAGLTAVAFTDSMNRFAHRAFSPRVAAFVRTSLVNWQASTQPMGEPVRAVSPECVNVSAGHKKHEWTSWACRTGVFEQFRTAAAAAAAAQPQ